MQIFSTAPFIYLLSFFSSFMLLNVHRRYRGGGWGGVEYLCPLLVTVKNFTTTCRSLSILCPLPVNVKNFTTTCRPLSILCPLPVNVKNFTTTCRSLSNLCPLPVNVKTFTTACRSLFILCPLPMSRTSRLHTDHYLSCVHCQSMSRTLFSVLGAPFYTCGN